MAADAVATVTTPKVGRQPANRPGRLTVLVITPWYPAIDDRVGGSFVAENARALASFADVHVIHLAAVGPRRPQVEKGNDEGPTVVRIRCRSAFVGVEVAGVVHALRAYARLRRRGVRPDIVHGYVLTAALPAAVVAALLRKPLFLTEQWSRLMERDPRPLTAMQRLVLVTAYRRARAVIAVGSELKRAIERLVPGATVYVVPNPVDVELFRPAVRAHRDDGRLRIVSVGRLVPYKRVDLLLAATRWLIEHRLRPHVEIVGDGPSRRALEDAAVDLGVGDVVSFRGELDRRQTAETIANADVVVICSEFETFCTVGAEAIASGVPVVATACGGPNDYVDSATGVLVEKHEPSDIGKAIVRVIVERHRFNPAAMHLRAAQTFSLSKVGEAIAAIYRRHADCAR